MYKLFSQRKKEEKGEMPDVYIYDDFPQTFRNQIMHILSDIYEEGAYSSNNCWEMTCDEFAREKGYKYLMDRYGNTNTKSALSHYLDNCNNDDFLDFLDFVFTEIIFNKRKGGFNPYAVKKGIDELNYRLKQHSLGYEFINGKLIEKTNEHIHQEIVKPALNLLNNKIFSGAEQEYFQAFDYYKQGKNKDAIFNAAKAFESVLKTICKKMKYPYDEAKDTAKPLIQHLIDNNFFPSYLESHLTGIRTTLESGVPTVRNKTSGHGQGQEVIDVSDEYVEYVLGLVATNIVLLVKIFNKKKSK